MTITVKSCGDCPFTDGFQCNASCVILPLDMHEHYWANTTHPSCPLRTEKITVELEGAEPEEEKPVLVGKLTKQIGFNNGDHFPIGTEVYQLKDRYYVGTYPYHMDTLKPYIEFIVK